MKRFLTFAYADYYASGGEGDFVGDFDTLEEAKASPSVERYPDSAGLWPENISVLDTTEATCHVGHKRRVGGSWEFTWSSPEPVERRENW